MSKPRTDLSHSKTDVNRYVKWLRSLSYVSDVLVNGSRSPLREKKARKDSDWDLIVLTNVPKLVLPDPRKQFKIHCDILILPEGQRGNYPKAATYE